MNSLKITFSILLVSLLVAGYAQNGAEICLEDLASNINKEGARSNLKSNTG